jgi:hypothetical protein
MGQEYQLAMGQELLWLALGQEYNEKMFPIHTSIILIGVPVGATSLWPCMVCCGSFTENHANGNEHSGKQMLVILFADVGSFVCRC